MALLLSLTSAAETKSSSSGSKKQVYLQKSMELKSFDETPQGFNDDNIQPALVDFGIVVLAPRSLGDIRLGGDFSFASSSLFGELYGDFIFKFSNVQLYLGGAYSVSDYGVSGGDFEDTHFQFGYISFRMGVSYHKWSFAKPYFYIRALGFEESDMKSYEGVDTRIAQDKGTLTQIGVKGEFGNLRYLVESAHYLLGVTAIASKGFSYRIDGESIYLNTAGVGYQLGATEVWVKYSVMSEPEDVVSYYYQLAHFVPKYTLSKEYATVQVRWRW